METVRKPTSATASKAKVSAEEDSDVRPYDILCGRSKTCFNNIGNRRFRITISMNLKKYDTLSSRSEKSKYIFNLARTLKDDVGFRFVHISKFGRVELTDEQIRAKIGHALRDLSKAQKEAAAVAARPLGTDEAQKIIESSKSPVPTGIPSSSAMVVTPEPLPRRVTNDFEAGIEAKLMALPRCPDIRKGAMMDATCSEASQQNVPHMIFFSSQQQDMLPIVEEASKFKIAPSDQDYTARKPAPVAAAAAATKEDTIDEDDFCLMPLRFDQPECHGMLDPLPLDVLPGFADLKMPPKARSFSMPNITFKDASAFVVMDDDADLGSICSLPYNDEVQHQPRYDDGPYHPRKTRASFPMMHQHHHHHQQSHHPDLMSMGSDDDDHMISLCESVDCLSMDLEQEVHA